MEQDKKKPFAVLSFLSGKGGSGKTTSSLAIAKILADVGFKVLLVDFDLATSGASYFFSPILTDSGKRGLADFIRDYHESKSHTPKSSTKQLDNLILAVGPNFDFIPSRTDLGKSFVSGPEISHIEFLTNKILKPLINEVGANYDYVLIDNQAGYTNTSAAGANVGSKAVIVSESDQISSDAVDNLIAQIGSKMPTFRRYLINKVEIKEAGDYRKKVETFKQMNRLPPLPFDFSVRNAFGEREIPINLEKPTPFLIALFTTVKEVVPENKDRLEKYETEKITTLFDRHQKELDEILKKRKERQNELLDLETGEKKKESDYRLFVNRILMFFTILIAALSISYFYLNTLPESFGVSQESLTNLRIDGLPDNILDSLETLRNQEFTDKDNFLKNIKLKIGDIQTGRYESLILRHTTLSIELPENINTIVIFALAIIISVFALGFGIRRYRHLSEMAELLEKRERNILILQQELSDLDKDVDRYKNLLVTRAHEYLIDFDHAK